MGYKTGLLGSIALVLALGGAANAQIGANLQFGDDTSAWANDGQCDDPRFEGPGAATFSVSADEMRDATDCEAAFEAGTITLVQDDIPPPPPPPEDDTDDTGVDTSGIDFGDDSGSFPNDGECDDPRFTGPGVWSGANDGGIRADASDCQAAVEAGTAQFTGDSGAPATEIDYGDDSGPFPNDGECDDPRFTGEGVWSGAGADGIRADATDCQAAVESGTAQFTGEIEAVDEVGMVDGIDFGDNSSTWANDGECDDGRFEGSGMGLTNFNHVQADANDCLAAYNAGTITYVGEADGGNFVDGIDFGDDSGVWANDGECDDARFAGDGMGLQDEDHVFADASDCMAAYNAGTIDLVQVTDDTDASGPIVNFGDDSSASAFDGVCDDPRFQGSGGASLLYPENQMADATDCRDAYNAGTVTLAL